MGTMTQRKRHFRQKMRSQRRHLVSWPQQQGRQWQRRQHRQKNNCFCPSSFLLLAPSAGLHLSLGGASTPTVAENMMYLLQLSRDFPSKTISGNGDNPLETQNKYEGMYSLESYVSEAN